MVNKKTSDKKKRTRPVKPLGGTKKAAMKKKKATVKRMTKKRAAPKGGEKVQSAGHRGVVNRGKRHRVSKKNLMNQTRNLVRQATQGVGETLKSEFGVDVTRIARRVGELATSDNLKRLKDTVTHPMTWADITRNRTLHQNETHEVARRSKPSSSILEGRTIPVDPFKTFFKQFHVDDLVTGRKAHTGSLLPGIQHNELHTNIRGGSGSHVQINRTKDGVQVLST